MKRNLIRNAKVIAILLMIPLVFTIRDGNVPNVGWNWSPMDFVFAFTVLFSAGLAYELIKTKLKTSRQRLVLGSAIAFAVCVFWVEMATGGVSRAVSHLLG
jgi:hypothetical protein